jgi:predicted  nucleic acid-binding Zn-ribbon protein
MLLVENDKVTRSLNSLLSDKERLENLLYLRKTNHRLTKVVSLDVKGLNSRVANVKKEDRELMDELNKSDNALLNKNTALRELDDKIRVLSRKYADLEAEAQEKLGLISSLRTKHDHIRLEIERLRGLINEEELSRIDLDIRNKEGRLRDLQADVDEAELIISEWREKIILKQRMVVSRTQSRVLLFEPDPNDPVDTYIADYVLSHVTTVPVKKIGRNRYLFGTRNIDINRSANGTIKVQMQNGELWDLEQFIELYHDKELQKLDVLGDNEELVVDERDDY